MFCFVLVSKPVTLGNSINENKLSEVSRKAGLQDIPAMEEANFIMEGGKVMQIKNPKLHGAGSANTWILRGLLCIFCSFVS